MLAAYIPKRVVDGADRHHEESVARMPVGAVHLVPQRLTRQRVFANQERPQIRLDDDRRIPLNRAVKPVQSRRGANPQIDCAGLHFTHSRWLVLVRLRPKVIVNIQGIDLRLAVHTGLLLAFLKAPSSSTASIFNAPSNALLTGAGAWPNDALSPAVATAANPATRKSLRPNRADVTPSSCLPDNCARSDFTLFSIPFAKPPAVRSWHRPRLCVNHADYGICCGREVTDYRPEATQ